MSWIVLGLACLAGFAMGFIFCDVTAENATKTNDKLEFDKIPTEELVVMFIGIASELEERGVVRRVARNPFEDINEKK